MPGSVLTSSTSSLPRSLTMMSTRVAPSQPSASCASVAEPQRRAVALGRQARRQVVVRAARRVLGAEVVEAAPCGDDLDGAERLAVEHADGDLLALDEALDQHVVVEAQRLLDGGLELELVARDADAERRAFARRLDHRPGSRRSRALPERRPRRVAPGHVAGRRRQVVQAEELLGLALVHRQRRRQHARAGVGNAEQLEQPLDAAVLAVAAVQRQERDVDARLPQHQIEVAVDEDRDGVVAALDERREDRLARAQRDVALADRPPSSTPILRCPSCLTGNLAVDPSKNLAVNARRASRDDVRTAFVVKKGAMTFLEAALEILSREGKPLALQGAHRAGDERRSCSPSSGARPR